MKKKKSYMDRKNIVSEGFYTKLLSLFVPNKIIKGLTKVKLDSLKAQADALDNYMKKAKKEQETAAEEMLQALEKQTGKKIKRYKSAKDRIQAYYNRNQ